MKSISLEHAMMLISLPSKLGAYYFSAGIGHCRTFYNAVVGTPLLPMLGKDGWTVELLLSVDAVNQACSSPMLW